MRPCARIELRILGVRRRSCSIKADTLRRSLQLGFQVQNDIVEQTSRNWVAATKALRREATLQSKGRRHFRTAAPGFEN